MTISRLVSARIEFEPRDLWVGVYWTWSGVHFWLYLTFVPCFPIVFVFEPIPGRLPWDELGFGWWSLPVMDALLHLRRIENKWMLSIDEAVEEEPKRNIYPTLRAAIRAAEAWYAAYIRRMVNE